MNTITQTTTAQQYLMHYLSPGGIVMMFAVSALALAICFLISCVAAVRKSKKLQRADRRLYFRNEVLSLMERLYELIFSATFILLFVGVYFTIDYFGISPALQTFWNKYNSFILLVFILLSVILNSWVDSHVIPLKHLHPGDRSAMRLIGMIYMLVIFVYIKFIYNDSNYDAIIMYFLTLVIGRFVYFDTSMDDFKQAMSQALWNLPILILALMCSALLAGFGFQNGYLLKLNGVVMNLFLGHLFLLVVICIVSRTRLLEAILKGMTR